MRSCMWLVCRLILSSPCCTGPIDVLWCVRLVQRLVDGRDCGSGPIHVRLRVRLIVGLIHKRGWSLRHAYKRHAIKSQGQAARQYLSGQSHELILLFILAKTISDQLVLSEQLVLHRLYVALPHEPIQTTWVDVKIKGLQSKDACLS